MNKTCKNKTENKRYKINRIIIKIRNKNQLYYLKYSHMLSTKMGNLLFILNGDFGKIYLLNNYIFIIIYL